MEWKMDEELLNAVKNVHIDWPQDGICSPANIIDA